MSNLFRSLRAAIFFGLLFLASLSLPATAQNCSDWAQVKAWKGSYTLVGNGTFTQAGALYTINQTAAANLNLTATSNACPGPLIWFAADTNYAGTLDDTLFDTVLGCITDSLLGSGGVSNSFLTLDFSAKTFSLFAVPTNNWEQTTDNCQGTTNHDQGSDYPMYSVTKWPLKFALPATLQPLTVRNFAYQDLSFFEGGSANVPWTLSMTLTPVVSDSDTVDDPCKKAAGSSIGCQNQSLGEDISVVGTGFYLHYEGDRAAGRSGANSIATADARMIDGWTLSVHHIYDHASNVVFMGDGNQRSAWQIAAPTFFNGNHLITPQDGSEVYVFDGPSGRHLQTVTPLTGALKYQFGYNVAGNLITITDANGNVTTVQRDATEHATAIVSPFAQTTTLSHDANGFLSQVADPAGHTDKFTNTSTGLITARTDPNGNGYTYAYDTNGRLSSDADSVGGSITVNRSDSASGYTVTNTTALGRTTTFQVTTPPFPGEQFTNTWPNGLQATLINTQQSGQLLENSALPDGTVTSGTKGPDPRWGLQAPVQSKSTRTLGNLSMKTTGSRTATLGVAGNPFSLTTLTDIEKVNGRTYTSVFTSSNKTYVDTTPMNRKTTMVLDSLERPSSLQVGVLQPVQLAYDTHSHLSTLTQGPRVNTLTYDTNGFLSSITDPLHLKTKFAHDAAGRLLTTTLPDNRVINYAYDNNGNLISITPPGKSAHAFSYTAVDALSAYTPPTVPATGATTYSYDDDHELTTITRPDGATIDYGYDNAGRRTSATFPTGSISYVYDTTTGNLANASIASGEAVAYGYNGPLPTSSTWTGTVTGRVSRAFNNNFWVTSQSLNGGSTINFTYDNDGLLTKAGSLAIKRDPQDGLVKGTTLGNAADVFTNDTFGDQIGYTAKYQTTALDNVKLTRDAGGRIKGKAETITGKATQYAYTYDAAGRLTKVAINGVLAATYSYDTNSNRSRAVTAAGTVNATYDAQDRQLTYGNTSYTYTANGELATQTVGSQTTTYTYDVFGSLIAATLPNGTVINYITDAEHNRVGKKVNGVLQQGFLYDGPRVVAQLNGSNTVVSQFIYAVAATAPDFMVQAGVTFRIFSDHLGSPRLVVNSSTGAIAQQIDYDEFGNVVNDTNPGFQPFAFAGGLYDQDTKLVRFGARDYNPTIGRWTAKDPILFNAGDTNLYGYVLADPVNLIDPFGLEDCDATCKMKKSTNGSSSFGADWNNSDYPTNVGKEVVVKVIKKGIEKGTDVKNLEQGSASKEAERMRKFSQEEATCNSKTLGERAKDLGRRLINGLQGK